MTTPRHVAVIDIGKTNAKLALVDTESLAEIAVLTRPNIVRPGPPWPHFDLEGHWQFLLAGLAEFQRSHGIDAISVTTHGASCVLLDGAGRLAAPMLDYEHAGPDETRAGYDGLRPPFSETGSPRLGMGLNIGAQLYWQFATDPGLRDRVRVILTYPQYWAFRLTGVAATDASSLGCHTDLWNPYAGRLSSLAQRLGIADRIAPTRPSSDVLGPVLPGIARVTGLPAMTPVHCGIHDSNASLLPHLLGQAAPFSVVSSGTWVISMALGGAAVTLDPAKDTLVNVNALSDPVPSARFMGGREFDLLLAEGYRDPIDEEALSVLDDGVMLLPAVVPDTGPFQGRPARWTAGEPEPGSGARSAAAGYYLALVTAHCLTLIGHRGTILVEGPFARNGAYCDMLSAATGSAVAKAGSATGTSQGAALLAAPGAISGLRYADHPPPRARDAMQRYARRWAEAVGD